MLDDPHEPTGRDGSKNKEGKAEQAEPDHKARNRALRDTEHNRGKKRKQQHGGKVGHDGFLPLASECASTAETIFRRPATTMNFVP